MRRLASCAVAVAAVLGVTSCSSDGGATKLLPSTTTTAPSGPTTNVGQLESADVIDAPHLHGTLLRVTYSSQAINGDAISVSGLIVYPNTPVPAGGRPIVTWAHGTTGLADECAPSRDATGLGGLGGFANALLDRGIVVVATDYEGLGTPGLHPYLVGESEGRGVLDIARAALRIPEAGARPDVVIWGHSQGGHAALFAQQMAARWAPELRVLGALAAAPAAELPTVARALEATPYFSFFIMVAASYAALYPELDAHDILTDEAIDRMDVVTDDCSVGITFKYLDLPASKALKADPLTVASWAARINENTPGAVRTDIPLFVYQGDEDEIIPVQTSEQLQQRLCVLGQVIERRVYPGESHGHVLTTALADALQWIDDRLTLKPATTSCMSS